MNGRFYLLLTGVWLTATVVSGQTVSTSASAAASPAAATAPSPSAAAPQSPSDADSPAYTYDPQGRRDPFITLLRRGADTDRARTGPRIAGLSGLEAAEVVLKGTMQSPTGYVALIEATDKKTYIVKTGDRLLDGTVRTITADTMVILQQVNDPLSLEKQREVRKILRQTDEVK